MDPRGSSIAIEEKNNYKKMEPTDPLISEVCLTSLFYWLTSMAALFYWSTSTVDMDHYLGPPFIDYIIRHNMLITKRRRSRWSRWNQAKVPSSTEPPQQWAGSERFQRNYPGIVQPFWNLSQQQLFQNINCQSGTIPTQITSKVFPKLLEFQENQLIKLNRSSLILRNNPTFNL